MKNLFKTNVVFARKAMKKTSYTMAVEAKKLDDVLEELKANDSVIKIKDKMLTSGQHLLTITIEYCGG